MIPCVRVCVCVRVFKISPPSTSSRMRKDHQTNITVTRSPSRSQQAGRATGDGECKKTERALLPCKRSSRRCWGRRPSAPRPPRPRRPRGGTPRAAHWRAAGAGVGRSSSVSGGICEALVMIVVVSNFDASGTINQKPCTPSTPVTRCKREGSWLSPRRSRRRPC